MSRFKNAFSAFMGRAPTPRYGGYGGYSYRPGRFSISTANMRSIKNAIYNRIAVDCASVDIRHARLNNDGKYDATIESDLNYALTISANVDQTGRALMQDVVMSMLDEGCVAIVPITTDKDIRFTDSYKIYELRVGKIIRWGPEYVEVEVYNQEVGRNETIIQLKRNVAIIENPFYAIMNEPNSTSQRLTSVLNKIDELNNENSANKIDLIVQLPYPIKSRSKQIEAERRRKDIEEQLTNSQYGIAYIDSAEHIIQLNRSVENNLWEQAKDLTQQLFTQLGMTQAILDGTADEQTMMNYMSRIVEPILTALVEEMDRKWISRTAKTQKQAILYFKNAFKLVPTTKIAEMAESLTRNEIVTSNEFRSFIGLQPSKDPKADQLINSNLNHPNEETPSNNNDADVQDLLEDIKQRKE